MYYSYPCPYCSKVFYTFNDDKWAAATALYNCIKKHLADYGEDNKEHKLDYSPEIDIKMIHEQMTESNAAPAGGYQI